MFLTLSNPNQHWHKVPSSPPTIDSLRVEKLSPPSLGHDQAF